jgi:hypothetical protein
MTQGMSLAPKACPEGSNRLAGQARVYTRCDVAGFFPLKERLYQAAATWLGVQKLEMNLASRFSLAVSRPRHP